MNSNSLSGSDSNARRPGPDVPWPIYAIAAISGLLVVARMKWPTLLFDNVSLILFAIGAGAVALPHLIRLLPPLKTLKAGPIEAEFKLEQELLQFERKVIASEA